MVIFFYDTNKIYGLMRKRSLNNDTWRSNALIHIARKYKCYISSFVFEELIENLYENEWIVISLQDLDKFLYDTWLKFHVSANSLDRKLSQYVRDEWDMAILSDAIAVQANYIITNNLDDFLTLAIREDFFIKTLAEVPKEFVE